MANSYTGITGDTSLNEAGDRKHAEYDFWAIRANNGNSNSNNQSVFAWGLVGRFQSNTNINDTGLIQQIKSVSPKLLLVVVKYVFTHR